MPAIDVITTVINFGALIFLGAQVMLARQAVKEASRGQEQEWLRQRKKAAIEASIYASQYQESLKAELPWNDSDPKAVSSFLEKAKGDSAKLALVRAYLNSLEDLAVGVKQGVFDLETIYMLSGRRIIDTARNYEPYIKSIRKEVNSSTVYCDLEDLAEMLKTQGIRHLMAGGEHYGSVRRAQDSNNQTS
jgi:hypothetical protein